MAGSFMDLRPNSLGPGHLGPRYIHMYYLVRTVQRSNNRCAYGLTAIQPEAKQQPKATVLFSGLVTAVAANKRPGLYW